MCRVIAQTGVPQDSDKKQLTVVILSESPMDKKAMTAALKKEREAFALIRGPYLDNTAYAKLQIDQTGVGYSLTFSANPTLSLIVSSSFAVSKLAAPLRAALAGRTISPSVFDMMLVLGRAETIARLTDAGEA